MGNGDVGQESGNRLVYVYRYMEIWSDDIDEGAYESVTVIDFDIDEARASDNGVVRVNGISDVEHLVSDFDFESVCSPFVDLENLDGRISP
jgi:hypothetical protein